MPDRNHRLASCLILGSLLLTGIGCATSSAPTGWLPSVEEAQQHTYGGWIEIELRNDAPPIQGELIAVSTDSMQVLTGGPKAVAKADIVDGSLSFGGWIEIKPRGDAPAVQGELVAVDIDSVYVLDYTLVAVAKADVVHASLFGYESEWEKLGMWSALGTLSTASHGWALVLSAPIWLLTGPIATSAQSAQPRLLFPDQEWASFRTYARFPAGLPPALPRASLRHALMKHKAPDVGR